MTNADHLARTTEHLAAARNLVVLTGAGMSKESGVPTFRDALTGLWSRYDPMELATPEAFGRDPALVFRWYFERWQRARAVVPHPGHLALTRMAARFRRFTIITQNVDGLHQRSGATEVIELHGSLEAFRCAGDGHAWDPDKYEVPVAEQASAAPTCAICDSPIRPGVVWFGESLPADAVTAAYEAVADADAMLVVGTSAVVHPAAELPLVAQREGASVIEINPDRTPLSSRVAVVWCERAGTALPALVRRLEERGEPR